LADHHGHREAAAEASAEADREAALGDREDRIREAVLEDR
jgi:hypothetical protein